MTPHRAALRRHLSTLALAAAAVVAPGAAHAATFSYSSSGSDPVVPIPDGGAGSNTPGTQVSAPITVSGLPGNVSALTVSIDGSACTANENATTVGIDHSWMGDLVIQLRSPDGTVVPLISRLGRTGEDFGYDANNFCGLTLDDAAATSIQSAPEVEPITGPWRPNSPLSAFMGETANGQWELLAQDFSRGDTGNIRAWSIHLDAAAPEADLSILQSPTTATATVGGTVTYTLMAHNAGPSAATGATVADTLPAGLTNATWTCAGSGGGTCTASGSGAVADTVNLPAGASVVYTVTATVNATGALSNTATVAAPAGVVDPTPANNSTGGTVTASAAAPRPVPSLSAGALGLLAGLLMLGARRRRVH
ncbi:proprotein convertase P-domain-containing protein [Ottowia sp.]|uniref:proprotein convertase P-domain-containing protein n=1 Tax=Ottowia sp. TaxID=1898956 RepID=UPI0025E90AE3|nr:proprotein convertase P-domain-containing protein [Ottowia sp.]